MLWFPEEGTRYKMLQSWLELKGFLLGYPGLFGAQCSDTHSWGPSHVFQPRVSHGA